MRSATSIGANIEEGIGAFTRKDFIYKLNVAYKEARESSYWIKLLNTSESLSNEEFNVLINLCEEIIKMLASSIITSRKNSD